MKRYQLALLTILSMGTMLLVGCGGGDDGGGGGGGGGGGDLPAFGTFRWIIDHC
jgi:hypothetical protein